MKIKLHKLAKTTPALRKEIRESSLSGPQLARKHGLSIDTIYKWKKRKEVMDLPHVRHNLDPDSNGIEIRDEVVPLMPMSTFYDTLSRMGITYKKKSLNIKVGMREPGRNLRIL